MPQYKTTPYCPKCKIGAAACIEQFRGEFFCSICHTPLLMVDTYRENYKTFRRVRKQSDSTEQQERSKEKG